MTRPADAGPATETAQRLDKWLWFARVAKSRTLAATAVTDGKIKVNRIRAEKPSQAIKIGDVITSRINRTVRVLRVAGIGHRRGPASEAQALYEDLTPPPQPTAGEAIGGGPEPVAWGARTAGAGRPTKRDRRLIASFKDRGSEGR
ncbi:RNA-binding protein S4 [Hyphomicrobium nitrativorans NL23]|uniref:RNA-binding protein S4 n=1 Tax=Hyphomicrobium nitrativorans NL23 TaxID=1029756 RepID=V5S9U2_9HYPH|nr:RNA-binding S4 domain-containing protein [Hyphomicrobium nitrativorans]AHB47393.1 RNA-binding protein S4 [Hyphomicrobium nitrativorans NL23]